MQLFLDRSKLKTLKILFPLHREGLTSYLSPVLGQYAIKNNEFITQFLLDFHLSTKNAFFDVFAPQNAEAGGSLYSEQLFIPLRIQVYKGGKFSLKVFLPELGFLFSTFFIKRRRLYKRFTAEKVTLVRNYKKLFQLTFFKYPHKQGSHALDIFKNYSQIRNAIFQAE